MAAVLGRTQVLEHTCRPMFACLASIGRIRSTGVSTKPTAPCPFAEI